MTEEKTIEEFNPTKAEITKIVDDLKHLKINGLEDKEGALAVDKGRKELKKIRVAIKKFGKSKREQYVLAQKEVIRQENELVEMIEPTEKILQEEQTRIKKELTMVTRRQILPDRIKRLEEIEIVAEEEMLLNMDDTKFIEYFYQKKADFMEKKAEEERLKREEEEAKMRKEREEIEASKARIAEAERVAKAEADAKKRAEEQAKLEAEAEKERVIKEREDAARKAEEDKRKAVEEAERKAKEEADRLVKEREEAERKAKEEAEKLRLEEKKKQKNKKYKAFLKKNGVDPDADNGDNIIIKRDGDTFKLYKKEDELIIK